MFARSWSSKTKMLCLLRLDQIRNRFIIIMYNKVHHLLSEFAIEFATELCCQILLSKVTNKLSESWCWNKCRLSVDQIRVLTVDDQPYWFLINTIFAIVLTNVISCTTFMSIKSSIYVLYITAYNPPNHL